MNITINCDGGARGNPGPAAIGFVVRQGEKNLVCHAHTIGSTTNNVAEYQAVISALDWLLSHKNEFNPNNQQCTINFLLDSKLVVNQLKGLYKINQPHLQTLAAIAKEKINQLKLTTSFSYIPRAQNHEPDQLLNQALNNTF